MSETIRTLSVATADARDVLASVGIHARVESHYAPASRATNFRDAIATEVTVRRRDAKHDALLALLQLPGAILSTDPDDRGPTVTIWRRRDEGQS